MKKYNLSKIMKRAWEIKRQDINNIFAICLEMAWTEEKNTKKDFTGYQEIAIVSKGATNPNIGTEYDSPCNYLTFKLWQKNNMRRIYMNDYKGRGCGYIDLNNENRIMNPAGYASAEETAKWFLSNYNVA